MARVLITGSSDGLGLMAARLIYLSSGMARGGNTDLSDPQWTRRSWNGMQAYSDSKLFDAMLSAGVARRWPDVLANSVEPGWVPTKMGGLGAPDDLSLAPVTQAWLATSDDAAALVSGRHFHHRQDRGLPDEVHVSKLQDALLDYCAVLTGVTIADERRQPQGR